MPRAMPFHVLAAVVLPFVAAAACSDGNGPDALAMTGTFRLDSVDGGPLPVILTQSLGGTYRLKSGRLDFARDGVEDSLRFGSFDNAGEQVGPEEVAREFPAWERRGDTILIVRVRVPVTYVDTALLRADTLTMRVARLGPRSGRSVLRYTRTAP